MPDSRYAVAEEAFEFARKCIWKNIPPDEAVKTLREQWRAALLEEVKQAEYNWDRVEKGE